MKQLFTVAAIIGSVVGVSIPTKPKPCDAPTIVRATIHATMDGDTLNLEPICPVGMMVDVNHLPAGLNAPGSYADAINKAQQIICTSKLI